ncbi:MAG TPA: phage holin family protein [Lunatimonas sp.]|nr:phage holin family protein [Lunatimonas sp.]
MMNISEILDTVKKLIELRIKIAINKITDDISTAVTRVVVLIMMVMAGVFVLLFASISLGFYLGTLFESVYLGFLSVGGIYLLLLLILFLIRNTLTFQTSLKTSLTKFIFLFKSKPVR